MNLPKLRGADGVRARMAEIQTKLDAAFPAQIEEPERDFGSALSGAINSTVGGNVPMNPMRGGIGLSAATTPEYLREPIRQAALRYGIDPGLLDALVGVESAYNPRARSHAGALGLTQLMPKTAEELGVTDRTNPLQSLNGGAKYLSQMMRRFGGDLQLALAAYNAGPGAVEKANGIPENGETPEYVKRVLSLLESKRKP